MIKISIKRILIWITVVTGLLSVLVFAWVSNRSMDRYFDSYLEEGYLNQVRNITEFGKIVIEQGYAQRAILNSYITDPILYVEIQGPGGDLLSYSGVMGTGKVDSQGSPGQGHGSNMGGLGGVGGPGTVGDPGSDFVYDAAVMSTDIQPILDNGVEIGTAVIVRTGDVADTRSKAVFREAILDGALFAALFAVAAAGLISLIIIRRISGDTERIMAYVADDNAPPATFSVSEYRILSRAVDAYRERIALKEKVRKEKFDRLLHDTKTPLTVLKSQLEGAVDGIIEIDRDRAENLLGTVDSLNHMLVDVTNIVEGEIALEPLVLETVDYSEQLTKIVSSLQSKFRSKNLELFYEAEPFILRTDVQLLNNAVYNILINSFKYTDSGGVSIGTSGMTLTIRDTGRGIGSSDISRIFRPYFRGANTAGTEGEGLGLFNVKANLERLGAQVAVSSVLNEFTEFTITFSST